MSIADDVEIVRVIVPSAAAAQVRLEAACEVAERNRISRYTMPDTRIGVGLAKVDA
jgi:hypothetical protein